MPDDTGNKTDNLAFPEELHGTVIDGIDLTILNLDALRLIHAHAQQDYELSDIQWEILKQTNSELKAIIPRLNGGAKEYFEDLHRRILDILNSINAG